MDPHSDISISSGCESHPNPGVSDWLIRLAEIVPVRLSICIRSHHYLCCALATGLTALYFVDLRYIMTRHYFSKFYNSKYMKVKICLTL